MLRRDYRFIVLIVVLLSLAAAVVATPRINLKAGTFHFERGSAATFLGLRLGLDLQGGVHLVYQTERPATPDELAGVVQKIERRINAFGVVEPVIQSLGNDRILVQLPGVKDVDEAKRLIGETAKLEFKERTCKDTLCTQFEDKDVGLSGDDLARAYQGRHQTTGQPIVNIEFNSRGARIFGDVTTRIAGTGNRIAIFLDNQELLAPVAQQAILGGRAFIEGRDFTSERVRTIAIQLESGRLDVPIKVIQERDVDATLGADSLRRSLLAAYAGLGLVALFMALYYRLSGAVSFLALLGYVTLVVAIFKLIPVTLTLAGIAGFILSIGMAVDANVLIFERMKEELRSGRSLLAAIEVGFSRAWPSIRDSNVSTFITCIILYWFGSRVGASLVAGFAVTLFIGVAVSMFSAITVSRTLLRLLAMTPAGRASGLFTPQAGQERPTPARAPATRS